LKSIVIIPRINGFFKLKEAVIYRSYGFNGFSVDQVQAAYRRDNPIDAYAVALVLQSSQADIDFGVPIFFLAEDHIEKVREAFRESDELTHSILGRGWANGPRPFLKVEDFL
jgi:hypothetical protein